MTKVRAFFIAAFVAATPALAQELTVGQYEYTNSCAYCHGASGRGDGPLVRFLTAKLPDLAPDPFREREDLLDQFVAPRLQKRGRPQITVADEFMLKGLFPFFASFFYEAGFDLALVAGADQATLKRGIQAANVPFCAPMQLFHGVAQRMAETEAEWLFIPMVRNVPPAEGQRCSAVC